MTEVAENLFITSSAYLKLGAARLAQDFPGIAFSTITSEEFAARVPEFVRRFRHYKRVVFYTYDFGMPRTTLWHGIVWWLGSQSVMLDGNGRTRQASFLRLLFKDGPQLLLEPFLLLYVFSRVIRDLTFLRSKPRAKHPEKMSIAYLRTDHWFGIKAGGSVTHIAGVANSFRDMGIPLFFLSSDRLELIDESRTPLVRVRPGEYIQNISDAPQIAYNLRLIRQGDLEFQRRRPTVVYQRYSQYNYAGAYLAAKWNIPFVLEYNGSEVWMARNWGTPFRFQRWAEEIETANLMAADAIVVVSQPMQAELVARGVEASKILVNPNGVDIERFDPEKVQDASRSLRRELEVDDKIVAGFIGTFGRWHGADVMAKTIRRVVTVNPNVHFLFIGDGVTMPAVRAVVARDGVQSNVTMAGTVPQDEGPKWLGACDILLSPHVPNPDGSPFFGSPTKLFEYMAMSKGIVASRIDQIAEILKDRETALMVRPLDVPDLSRAILELAANAELRDFLGKNAREEVLRSHTWRIHTQRILNHVRKTLLS